MGLVIAGRPVCRLPKISDSVTNNTFKLPRNICKPREMYPKVKVRKDKEAADGYAYEKSSLQSLKAFGWLSLNHLSSQDEYPGSVVRIPPSKSPTPTLHQAFKEETTQKKITDAKEKGKNVRPTSAPRPRAVLSSPDNDGIIGSKGHTKRELLTGLKNHNSCRNRHVRCKIFPTSAVAESFAPSQQPNKGSSTDFKDHIQAKGRAAIAGSSTRAGHQKKITPAPIQS